MSERRYRQSVENNRKNLIEVLGVTTADVEYALVSEERSELLWRRYQEEGDRLDRAYRESVEARDKAVGASVEDTTRYSNPRVA